MKKPVSRTEPPAPSPEPGEPLAKIEAIILELDQLRARERDASIASAYRAAIDRLHGLAYRLQTRPMPKVYGLPGKTAAPSETPSPAAPPAPAREPHPEPPQRPLPLGPVRAIVKARKPRR